MNAASFQSIFFFFAGLLAGCTGNSVELEMAGSPDMETRSVCVGRYVLDIPVQWSRQLNGVGAGGDATFYFGHDEDFTKVDAAVVGSRDREAFKAAVVARQSELMQKESFATDGPVFVSHETLDSGTELISFYASPDSTDAIRLEVHGLLEDSHIVLAETAYSADTRADVQSRLDAMLSAVRSAGGTTNEDAGFCIGNVVFDLGNDYEEAGFAYTGSLDGVPVTLQIDINTFEQAADEPALVERGEANLKGFGIRPEKLRAGHRLVAGDAGDEWLGAFVEEGSRLHGFYAETRTRKPTRESPKTLISLSTGDEDAAASQVGMKDAVAVALWDRVVASLRKRGIRRDAGS